MKTKLFLSSVCITALLPCGEGIDGAVAGTTLRELVRASDVIARAIVLKSEQNEGGSGIASLRADVFYRGSVERGEIRISWEYGPEEMRIPCVGSVYVLFLKKGNLGILEETHPMASYWQVKSEYRSSRQVIPYVFPVTMVDVGSEGLFQDVEVDIEGIPREAKPTRIRSIPLDKLVPAIRGILANEKSQ